MRASTKELYRKARKQQLSHGQALRLYTEELNLAVYSGFHDWHTDGDSFEKSASMQLWLLVSRNASDGTRELVGNQTSLMVVPADVYAQYEATIAYHRRQEGPSKDDQCWLHMLDQLACTLRVEEGDAVLYRKGVYHRTQDALNDREVLSCDVQQAYSMVDGHHQEHGDLGL